MTFYPSARKEGLAIEELDGELLIYDLDSDRAHCLNGEAAAVWKLCDGSRSLAELATAVAPKAPEEIAEAIVNHALEGLSKRKLLIGELPETGHGVSRRELLRKLAIVGATGLALPVVKSIVAPTAAQAATCLPPGAVCATSAQCCSGLCVSGVCAPTRRDTCLPSGAMCSDSAQCCSGQCVNGVCV